MSIQLIHDLDDQRVARYRNLKTDRSRVGSDSSFIVEGRLCVMELAKSKLVTRSVLVEDGRQDEASSWYASDVSIYVVSAQHIRELVGFDFHRGILACGERPVDLRLDALTFDDSKTAIALAVFGVSLHDNLGSMIRTATGLGINRLIIGPRTVDPFSRRVVRVSMGSVFAQSIYRVDDPGVELSRIAQSKNVRVVATTLSENATPLDCFRRDDRPILLVFGSEPDGVGHEVEVASTDRLTIPMRFGRDSLNVSIAAAIFMYELSRT